MTHVVRASRDTHSPLVRATLSSRFVAAMMMASLLVVVDLTSHVTSSSGIGSRCPSSSAAVRDQTDDCLDDFRSFQENFRLTGSHLFTSVDVEIIRSLCSTLKASMKCLKSLRDRCPSNQHRNQFDSALRPYVALIELCNHYRLHEDYAMNQNCLHGQKETSERCYRSFRSQVDHQRTSQSQQPQVQQFCGYMNQLVSCVRSNLAMVCEQTSSSTIVELLVKAAVEGSHKCRSTTTSQDYAVTVSTPKTSHVAPQRRSASSQRPSAGTRQTIVGATIPVAYFYIKNRLFSCL